MEVLANSLMDIGLLIVTFGQGCSMLLISHTAACIAFVFTSDCVRAWLSFGCLALRVALGWLVYITSLEHVLYVIFAVVRLLFEAIETALGDIVAFGKLLTRCGFLLMS